MRLRIRLSVQTVFVRVSKNSQITEIFHSSLKVFDVYLSIFASSRVVLVPDRPRTTLPPANLTVTEILMNSRPRFAFLLVAIAALWFSSARAAFAQSQSVSLSATQASNSRASVAFDKLKSLAGTWEADTPKGKITAKFELTSGDTVILERLSSPSDGEMLTLYTLDGDRVLLTHYCHIGNQPRMQASSFDPKTSEIDFSFVDITGLANSAAPHMHQAVFTLSGSDRLTENWTFYQDGKPAMTIPIVFHRVA